MARNPAKVSTAIITLLMMYSSGLPILTIEVNPSHLTLIVLNCIHRTAVTTEINALLRHSHISTSVGNAAFHDIK